MTTARQAIARSNAAESWHRCRRTDEFQYWQDDRMIATRSLAEVRERHHAMVVGACDNIGPVELGFHIVRVR